MPCQCRLLPLVALLALAACSASSGGVARGPLGGFSGSPGLIEPPPPVPRGERDARYEACRAEATRVVQFRERGQLMRQDETESGRGTVTVAPFGRVESDRAAAQIDRDRLIADCLRASERPAAAAPPAGAR
jgi:hypothetical protein